MYESSTYVTRSYDELINLPYSRIVGMYIEFSEHFVNNYTQSFNQSISKRENDNVSP